MSGEPFLFLSGVTPKDCPCHRPIPYPLFSSSAGQAKTFPFLSSDDTSACHVPTPLSPLKRKVSWGVSPPDPQKRVRLRGTWVEECLQQERMPDCPCVLLMNVCLQQEPTQDCPCEHQGHECRQSERTENRQEHFPARDCRQDYRAAPEKKDGRQMSSCLSSTVCRAWLSRKNNTHPHAHDFGWHTAETQSHRQNL